MEFHGLAGTKSYKSGPMKRSHWIWVILGGLPPIFSPKLPSDGCIQKRWSTSTCCEFHLQTLPNPLKAPNHRHAQQLHAGARHHRQEGAVVGLLEDIPVYQFPASGVWREEDISGALGSLEIGWEKKSHSSLH